MSSLNWAVEDYWRGGIFLKQDSNSLILELDEVRREMTLRVRGCSPLHAFVSIVEAIDTLLSESLQIKTNVFAACPHCMRTFLCHNSDTVNKFSLELLETVISDNKSTLPCARHLASDYINLMKNAPPPLVALDNQHYKQITGNFQSQYHEWQS